MPVPITNDSMARDITVDSKEMKFPIEARILAVADVCEALTASRPYRPAMSEEQTIEILTGGSGTAFCPEVVNAFLKFQEESDLFEQLKARDLP